MNASKVKTRCDFYFFEEKIFFALRTFYLCFNTKFQRYAYLKLTYRVCHGYLQHLCNVIVIILELKRAFNFNGTVSYTFFRGSLLQTSSLENFWFINQTNISFKQHSFSSYKNTNNVCKKFQLKFPFSRHINKNYWINKTKLLIYLSHSFCTTPQNHKIYARLLDFF